MKLLHRFYLNPSFPLAYFILMWCKFIHPRKDLFIKLYGHMLIGPGLVATVDIWLALAISYRWKFGIKAMHLQSLWNDSMKRAQYMFEFKMFLTGSFMTVCVFMNFYIYLSTYISKCIYIFLFIYISISTTTCVFIYIYYY